MRQTEMRRMRACVRIYHPLTFIMLMSFHSVVCSGAGGFGTSGCEVGAAAAACGAAEAEAVAVAAAAP